MSPEFQARLLEVVVELVQADIARCKSDNTDLRLPGHRRAYGALTPSIVKRFPHMHPSTVRNKLHQLKDAGLLEYWMPYQSTIRWFPVSLIPKDTP